MKDVGIRIRVEKELREAFRNACLIENREASHVLRELMRNYIDQQINGKQGNLFAPSIENAQESTKRTHDSNHRII